MNGSNSKTGHQDLKLSLQEILQQGAGSSGTSVTCLDTTSEPAGKIQVKGGDEPMVQDQPKTQQAISPRGAVTLTYRCRGLVLLVYLQKGGRDSWQLEQEDFAWRGKQCLEPPGEDSKKLRLVRVEHEPGALSNRGIDTRIRKGKHLQGLLRDQRRRDTLLQKWSGPQKGPGMTEAQGPIGKP
jgi:hypothetical protein